MASDAPVLIINDDEVVEQSASPQKPADKTKPCEDKPCEEIRLDLDEKWRDEFAEKLIPLTEADAKAIAAAMAEAANAPPPMGANFMDYDDAAPISFDRDELCSGLAADPTIPVFEVKEEKKNAAKFCVFTDTKPKGGFPDYVGRLPFLSGRQTDESFARFPTSHKSDTDRVCAANDWSGDTCSNFESNFIDLVVKDYNPTVKEKTDDYGRQFFHFDNGVSESLTVSVFRVGGVARVCINNVIIPLNEFLTFQSCVEFSNRPNEKNTQEKLAPYEIRRAPTISNWPDAVHIKTSKGEVFEVKGVTTKTISTVFAHLSKKYMNMI
jgi:hypothetical protein